MSVPVQDTRNINALGMSVTINMDTSGDSYAGASPTVPRAWVGTLSLRTDANTGELTLEGGHDVTTGAANKIDVYWDGGKHTAMVVGTVAGAVVPIDGGSGDDLPDVDTEIVAMVPQLEAVGIVGDNMVSLLARADTRATVKLVNGATIHQTIDIESGTDGYGWNSSDGVTNPIAGDTILSALFSHDDGVNARSVGVLAVKA